MELNVDSILNRNTGPKTTRPSALVGVLRVGLFATQKPAFETAFHRAIRVKLSDRAVSNQKFLLQSVEV